LLKVSNDQNKKPYVMNLSEFHLDRTMNEVGIKILPRQAINYTNTFSLFFFSFPKVVNFL